MLTLPRFHRPARGLLLLGICLLILSALPARPTSAAVIPLPLDNSLDDFTRGTFQRSSLSSLQANPAGNDLPGAAQLAPIGILKEWFKSPSVLPEKLTDVGAVAIGNHIFVVGGLVNSALTEHVWSTAIDQSSGEPLAPGWRAEPSLPALRTSDQRTGATAARAVAAVTAVQTNAATSSGYIYVLGGSVKPPSSTQKISSYGVSIAKVTNGHIDTTYGTNGWVISDAKSGCALCDTRLRIPPNQGGIPNGVQSASAVSFTVGGKTYIYLLGGLMRYYQGTAAVEAGTFLVFYAQVRASDGMLVKPSSPATPGWDSLTSIPQPTGVTLSIQAGIWDASAVADHFDVGGGVGGDVLYMMGGQLQSTVGNGSQVPDIYNSQVFRALIGSDAKLTWTTAAGSNHWTGLLPTARLGMGAVDFQGTLYLTGGRPIANGAPDDPQAAVLTSYVEDDLTLADLGTNGSNFIINANVLGGQTTPTPRTRHGSVVIPATSSSASEAAYVYVIAGLGSSKDTLPDDNDGSNTLIYGKIGKSENTTENGFTGSGWYYSSPYDMKSTVALLQKVMWTTSITGTRPMDIQLQYRTSTATNCGDSTAFNGSAWQPPNSWLDGSPDGYYSKTGANQLNEATVTTQPSHCMQYRAKLINSSTGAKITPSLLNMIIQVTVPGYPDLKVQTLQARKDASGSLTGLLVQIQNQNTVEQTQPANLYGGDHGSFFVDMFVFPPGTTEKAPKLPLYLNPTNPPSKACASVTKDQMGINVTLTISQWYNPDTDATCASDPKDILSLFPTGGHYVVYVAVDSDGCSSHGCVNEASTGGESNNLKRLEFDLPVSGPTKRTILLPLVMR
jgi:hypothetical protein